MVDWHLVLSLMKGSFASEWQIAYLNAWHFGIATHEQWEVRCPDRFLFERCGFDCHKCKEHNCGRIHVNTTNLELGPKLLILVR
jgi:hypothetical protein